MKNNIGFFEQFYVALMKHKEYKILTDLSKRQKVIYFLGITFLLTLIAYVVPMASFLTGLGGYEEFFGKKLPAFSVEKGELSIEEPLDFRLNGVHIIVDDSVDAYSQKDVDEAEELIMYFSRHNIVTNVSAIPLEIQYGFWGDDKIDNSYMVGLAPAFYGMAAFSVVFAWIAQMFAYSFLALLFAACSLGLNRMSGANLPFRRLFWIAIYAESVFALASHLVVYFVSGGFSFVIYLTSAMISIRALNTGILLYAAPPEL